MNAKKLLGAALGVLLLTSATAQIDSTHSTGRKKQPVLSHGPSRTKQSPSQMEQYRKEDRLKVEIDQIPDALRLTLEGAETYRGWHYGEFYLDRTNNQYILHLTEDNSTRTFVFDQEGQLVSNKKPVKPKRKAKKSASH